MKLWPVILLSASLAMCLDAQNASGEFKATKTRKVWADHTNIVWMASGQSRAVMTKENAVRFATTPKDSFDIPIVAVADNVTGNVWVGKKSDLYVETGSGIVGISLPYSGVLIWDRGLMTSMRSKETVDDLVKRFETKADLTQLIKIYDPVTDLRPALDPTFFSTLPGSAADVKGARIKSYQIADGELELEMENPARVHTATLWIDLAQRTIVKVIQDGEQVIPKTATPVSSGTDTNSSPAPRERN